MENVQKNVSLKSRVFQGSFWLGAGSGAEQGLRFLRNIILARLLAPEVFGEMAIVLAISAAFESFTEIGIKEAIIQSPKGQDRLYLNGAWWISFIRAVILYTIAYIGSPWLAQFYNNPELSILMRIAFLSIIFNGMISARAYVTIKQMKFKRWVLLYHGGSALGILTAISLVFYIPSVWALVIGFTIESVARCLLSYILCPYKPGLNFDKESLRSLLKYSKGMLGLPILTFIFLRTDVFVIGKLLPFELLGLYTMSVAVARMPFQFISSITSRIMMPMFSEMQADKARTNNSILTITSVITFIGFPMFFFVILYGADLLTLVYGPKYAAVAVPFAIIFALELLRVSSTPLVAVYLAIGRPELHRLFVSVRAVLIILLIFPAVKWFGLSGAATAGLIAMAGGYLFQVNRMRQLTGLNLRQYSLVFLGAFAISLIVFLSWLITDNFLPSKPIIKILPGVIGCLFAYGLALGVFFMKKKELHYLWQPIKKNYEE